MFKDRIQAAQQLAQALTHLKASRPLVLGIARGAVPMAAEIARLLDTDWDVLLAKKISAPGNPEFAVAAVDESGWVYRSDLVAQLDIDESYLEQEKTRQLEVMRQRRVQYEAITPHLDPDHRTVIVVDDGLATGATMLAALHGLKQQGAVQIICAAPIGSQASVLAAKQVADEVVCLLIPDAFASVSQGYEQFEQVTDDEILELLRQKAT